MFTIWLHKILLDINKYKNESKKHNTLQWQILGLTHIVNAKLFRVHVELVAVKHIVTEIVILIIKII